MILVMETNYNTATMINVCPSCGQYAVEKEIRPSGPGRALAVCPACGHAHPFAYLPLFVITGASGAGKSSLCLPAAACDRARVHLETDILWGALPASAEDDYAAYHGHWLRLARNIAQAGRPVVLYNSSHPGQLENSPERRYFSHVYFLALVCAPETLAARLRARPAWRASSSAGFIEGMLAYNAWFQAQGALPNAPLDLLDTTGQTPAQTLAALLAWLDQRGPG